MRTHYDQDTVHAAIVANRSPWNPLELAHGRSPDCEKRSKHQNLYVVDAANKLQAVPDELRRCRCECVPTCANCQSRIPARPYKARSRKKTLHMTYQRRQTAVDSALCYAVALVLVAAAHSRKPKISQCLFTL